MPRNSGFTLIEALAAVTIITILATLGLKVGQSVLQTARSMRCVASLRILHQGALAYANDHQGELPVDRDNNSTGTTWYMALLNFNNPKNAYVKHPGYNKRKPPYFCEENHVTQGGGNIGWTNYAINGNLYDGGTNLGGVPPDGTVEEFKSGRTGNRLSQLLSNKALFLDSSNGNGGTWYGVSGARWGTSGWVDVHEVHGSRVNVVFLDGHIESPRVFPRIFDTQHNLNEMKAEWFWPVKY